MDMAEVERWQEYVRIRDVEIKKLEKLLAEGMNVIPINKDVLKNPTALLNWKTKVIAYFKHKGNEMDINMKYGTGKDAQRIADLQAVIDGALDRLWDMSLADDGQAWKEAERFYSKYRDNWGKPRGE